MLINKCKMLIYSNIRISLGKSILKIKINTKINVKRIEY